MLSKRVYKNNGFQRCVLNQLSKQIHEFATW